VRAIELETVDAAPARVYEALTTREGIDAWWGRAVTGGSARGDVVELDHGLGAVMRMRVTEAVPGERVVWQCESEFTDPGNPATEWRGTRIAFELAPVGDAAERAWMRDRAGIGPGGTVLRFRHDGWPEGARWLGFCASAWGVTLAGLAASLASAPTR
jgi:uncharacterized protein YndB with AHSA1/START domain